MDDDREFVDYYAILEVRPDCDAKELEQAYRHLAKLYHPDHAETSDIDKFNAVITAYRALRDAVDRAEYDARYATGRRNPTSGDFLRDPIRSPEENGALSDAEAHRRMLAMLYDRRRRHVTDAGVGPLILQEKLQCSEEEFAFHAWYLKEKGFIETTEQGVLAITIQGVDHVISSSLEAKARQVRIAQLTGREGDFGDSPMVD